MTDTHDQAPLPCTNTPINCFDGHLQGKPRLASSYAFENEIMLRQQKAYEETQYHTTYITEYFF